jgi:protein ImuB
MSNQVFRRLVVWCPDWPVVAALSATGTSPDLPAAVFDANRVLACSGTARSQGVTRGMRRREAQGRCPELVVCDHDPSRDARVFEPVAAAVESLVPGVEVVRPGLLAVPVRGPARYFGSEQAAAERIVDQVGVTGVEGQIGVADGMFAAILAARRGVLVEPGGSRDFLAPLLIDEIDQPADQRADRAALVDLLRRLGIRTLGDFAALPASDVSTRFGADALMAHRAARGEEERPPERRRPTPDLAVTEELDPPVDRVDAAAFAAKVLAERLHTRLGDLGLACTRLGISARTEHGEEMHRVWRCAEPLTPAGTADRVRWQLDGWLSGKPGTPRPTAEVSLLSLAPEEVISAGGLQLDLVRAATGEADDRAGRAFVRVQGMLGPDAVVTGVLGGGRDFRDQVVFVPWGDQRAPGLEPEQPWPGRIPAPSPSVVPESAWPVGVLDAEDQPVDITERHGLTAAPRQVVLDSGRARAVCGWAGPWPVDERWWIELGTSEEDLVSLRGKENAATHNRRRRVVRVQVVLADDSRENESSGGEVALLLVHEQGRWWVQGVYR